jgi:hypothetical protein
MNEYLLDFCRMVFRPYYGEIVSESKMAEEKDNFVNQVNQFKLEPGQRRDISVDGFSLLIECSTDERDPSYKLHDFYLQRQYLPKESPLPLITTSEGNKGDRYVLNRTNLDEIIPMRLIQGFIKELQPREVAQT